MILSLYLHSAGSACCPVKHLSRFMLLATRSQRVRKGKERLGRAAAMILTEELAIERSSSAWLPLAHKPGLVELG